MSSIIRKVNDKYFEISLNELYKTRQDNNLTTDQLVEKYKGRILDGTLNRVRELEEWEVKAFEVQETLKSITEDIEDINELLKVFKND